MRDAMEDLKLDELWGVCAVQQRRTLAPRVEAFGAEHNVAMYRS
jgi:hypothetical protein